MATKDAAAANRRAAEARARADASKGGPGSRLLLIAIGVVVLAGIAAFAISVASDSGRSDAIEDTALGVSVGGPSLPTAVDSDPDPALGETFPALEGTGIDGEPLAIVPGEGPMLVVYLAHWCSVCQDEVPVLRDWIAAGGAGPVDVVAVATDLDPARGNWPPSRWLADEGWAQPTLVDPDGAAGVAAGKRAVPYFVALDGDGSVVARTSGALDPAQLDTLVALAAET